MKASKKILLPTDFSENSENVIPYAVDLVKRSGGELSLLHVFDVPFVAPINTFNTSEKNKEIVEDELRSNARLKLKNITDKQNVSSVPNLSLVRKGEVKEEILNVIKDGEINMVVMGTKGETAARGLFAGSIAKALVQNAPCPVLAIPNGASFNGINKIVYATDLQQDETNTINYLVEFAKLYDASLVILHIDHESEVKEWSVDLMMGMIEITDYPKIAYKEMVLNDVTEGINEYINEQKPDVLAMTTHTTTLYDKIFHKSITKQLLMHTHIPLLAFSDKKHDVIFFG